MPEELNGYSIIASAITGIDTYVILGETWNDGLKYVTATYSLGETEWRNGRYFDAPYSTTNKANARFDFIRRVSEGWGI